MKQIRDAWFGIFNGISQITFIENPHFGLIVFLSIFFLDIYPGIAVVIGSFISYVIALNIYTREFAISGLATFNTTLLILTVYFFLGGFTSLFYVIPATLLCMLVFHMSSFYLERVNLVPFSIPAAISAYILMGLNRLWPGIFFTGAYSYRLITIFEQFDFGKLNHFLYASGDIYFQSNLAFSIILIICFLIFKRKNIIYLLLAYFFTFLIYFFIGKILPINVMDFTIFNVLLGMLAMEEFNLLPLDKMWLLKLFLLSTAIVLLKFVLDYLLGLIDLPSLVVSFIIVCEVILLYQNWPKNVIGKA